MNSPVPFARRLLRSRAPRLVLLAAVLALPPALSLRAGAQDDPVVAKVDGTEVHASDVAIADEDVGQNMNQMPPEARREYLATYLTDMMLVAKAAEAQHLADGKDFKQRMAYFRNKALMELMLQSQAKAAISDTALHQLYDEATKQMAGQKEVRARHILVNSEDEAKAVLAELQKGADFAELAKQKSSDPGAAEGGDLGYFPKEAMVPEFAEAAFNLQKGQLSEPVRTRFGWHIIKVEDIRDREVPAFDKVRDQLETHLVRKAQADMITKLRGDAKIERPGQPAQQQPDPAAKK
jgi:peptidyl-prolyl cis-trans isomerase C